MVTDSHDPPLQDWITNLYKVRLQEAQFIAFTITGSDAEPTSLDDNVS